MSHLKRIFLNPPHQSGTEQKWLSKVLNSNYLAPVGPMLDEFEQTLGRSLGLVGQSFDKDLSCLPLVLNSGTSAIHLALRLLEVQAGDTVICQSMTFAGSAFPINYLGAEPVFIDSSKGAFNMDPDLLEEAIIDCFNSGRKPKAIIVVHLYGFIYNVKRIHAIARSYDIPIIEDAAEALGSRFKGQSCGTFGDFGILSFNGNKIITTAGGGALMLKDSKLRERALYLAQQAKLPTDHYHHNEVGFNYRMSSLNAAVGCAQLEILNLRLEQKKQIYQRYQKVVNSFQGIELYTESDERQQPNHWLNILVLDSVICQLTTSEVVEAFEKANIEARRLWKPMHLQPLYTKAKSYLNGVSDQWFQRGVGLPSGTEMNDEDWSRIQRVFETLFIRNK
ncbi:DegT/DnrJ/EryC1/StrS family aminotransferase [Flavobacteriaceae bacterium]|nr:DegT/DnrJ/EryC1/StrS family aminotransferase [Flavobacteriaceae bacterium]